MIRLGLLFVLTAIMAAVVAYGAPPEGGPGPFRDWYRSLMRPDVGTSCCDESDCRPVEAWRMTRTGEDEDGRPIFDYEVLITPASHGADEPEWVIVPREKILARDNPTGQPVVCWTPLTGVLCFVLPALT